MNSLPSTLVESEWTSDDWETPDNIAKGMCNLILPTDKIILEPCAGTGQIAKYVPQDRQLYCFEVNEKRIAKGVEQHGLNYSLQRDFLKNSDTCEMPTFDLVISNPPFSLAMEFISRSLELLHPDYQYARLLFLMPIDIFFSHKRSQQFEMLNAHIHHIHKIVGRVDYLKHGVPASECQKFKHGKPMFNSKGNPIKMSGRQCYDAVFDIRLGKQPTMMSQLEV